MSTVKINTGDLADLRAHLEDLPSSVRRNEVNPLQAELAQLPPVRGSVVKVSVSALERALGLVQSSAYLEGVDTNRAKRLDQTFSIALGYSARLRSLAQASAAPRRPRPDSPAAVQGEDVLEVDMGDTNAAIREAYDAESEDLSDEELAAYEAELDG